MEFTTEAIRSRVFLCWEVFDSWVNLLNSFSLDLMQHFLSVLGHEERSPSTTPVTRVSAVSLVTFHDTCYTGQCSVPCHLPWHLLHGSAQCPVSPSTSPVTRVSAVSRVTSHDTCYTGQRSVPCHLPRHLLHGSVQCPRERTCCLQTLSSSSGIMSPWWW